MREGRLSRKEISGLGSRFLKRQGSQAIQCVTVPFTGGNAADLDHLCSMQGPVKPAGPDLRPLIGKKTEAGR